MIEAFKTPWRMTHRPTCAPLPRVRTPTVPIRIVQPIAALSNAPQARDQITCTLPSSIIQASQVQDENFYNMVAAVAAFLEREERFPVKGERVLGVDAALWLNNARRNLMTVPIDPPYKSMVQERKSRRTRLMYAVLPAWRYKLEPLEVMSDPDACHAVVCLKRQLAQSKLQNRRFKGKLRLMWQDAVIMDIEGTLRPCVRDAFDKHIKDWRELDTDDIRFSKNFSKVVDHYERTGTVPKTVLGTRCTDPGCKMHKSGIHFHRSEAEEENARLSAWRTFIMDKLSRDNLTAEQSETLARYPHLWNPKVVYPYPCCIHQVRTLDQLTEQGLLPQGLVQSLSNGNWNDVLSVYQTTVPDIDWVLSNDAPTDGTIRRARIWLDSLYQVVAFVKKHGQVPKHATAGMSMSKELAQGDKKVLWDVESAREHNISANWMACQRQAFVRGKAAGARIELLDEMLTHKLGVDWRQSTATQKHAKLWEEQFEVLNRYIYKHGRWPYPRDVYTDETTSTSVRIGAWICSQRSSQRKLTPEQSAKLLSFNSNWKLAARDQQEWMWESNMELLRRHMKRNGTVTRACQVMRSNGVMFEVGAWVYEQRKRHKCGELTPSLAAEMSGIRVPGFS